MYANARDFGFYKNGNSLFLEYELRSACTSTKQAGWNLIKRTSTGGLFKSYNVDVSTRSSLNLLISPLIFDCKILKSLPYCDDMKAEYVDM